MKGLLNKIILIIVMSSSFISQSQCANNIHYPVKVTLYPMFLNEYNITGHIEAEIINPNNLPIGIQKEYNFEKDCYYINYRPDGNKKPPINPEKKYKGVKSIVVYLDVDEIKTFLINVNKDARKISNKILGDWKRGYNIIKNNCADAVSRALNITGEIKDDLGITIPKYVYNNILRHKQICCELVNEKY
tara:strand:+ start:311 stop:877 length:567 start_codon:yes stop_codon:yes gene_type:complete